MRGNSPPTPPPTPAILTRRTFLAASVASTAALALYGNDISRHELEITHPTFFIRNLPPAFDGFRIVQFSDIHLMQYTEDFFLREVIAQVNALSPDLLLITGDYISRGPLSIEISLSAAARCAAILSALTCPARYGILGNHDLFVGAPRRPRPPRKQRPPRPRQPARPHRAPRSPHHPRRRRRHLATASLTSSLADPRKARRPRHPHGARTRLRRPVAVHERGHLVSLILSGHSHGGQVRIPGFRPLALPPLGRRYPEGHYRVGPCQLYVNRGIGTVGVPFRLNCPPEITLATLRPAPAADVTFPPFASVSEIVPGFSPNVSRFGFCL